MTRREQDEIGCGLFVVLIVGAMSLARCWVGDADAQERRPELADYLVLARAGAKEESLFPGAGQTVQEHEAAERDGMSLIDAVYSRGAARAHESYVAFARDYSPHVFTPDAGRPWVADLRVGDRQPAGWPPGLFWHPDPRGRRQSGFPAWALMLTNAQSIRRGAVPLSCPAPPDHWGGPMDHARGVASGWIPMHCGASRNEGWLVPALHTAAERQAAYSSESNGPVPARLARGRQ